MRQLKVPQGTLWVKRVGWAIRHVGFTPNYGRIL